MARSATSLRDPPLIPSPFFAVLERHLASQLEPFADFLAEHGIDRPDRGEIPLADLAAAWREITTGTDPDWLALNLEFRLYALRNPETRERLAAQDRDDR